MSPSPARSARRCAAPPRPGSSGSSSRSTGSTRSSPRSPPAPPISCSTIWTSPTLREAVGAGRRPRADRGERRRHPGDDPRQGGDRRHLRLGRPHHPVGAGGRHRPGFRSATALRRVSSVALRHAPRPRSSPVSGWCLSSQRLTIRRLRVFERKKKSGMVADQGDRAEQRCRRRHCRPSARVAFRHAEVARLPDQPGAHRRGDDVADHRDQVEHRRRGRSGGWCRAR